MRTKQLYRGINNSAKIRVVLNGVHIYTTVAETTRMFGVSAHREAVEYALGEIAKNPFLEHRRGRSVLGFGTTFNGVDVQVDL